MTLPARGRRVRCPATPDSTRPTTPSCPTGRRWPGWGWAPRTWWLGTRANTRWRGSRRTTSTGRGEGEQFLKSRTWRKGRARSLLSRIGPQAVWWEFTEVESSSCQSCHYRSRPNLTFALLCFRKNNLAAKKSRDARRVRENQLRLRVLCLENANRVLREQMDRKDADLAQLRWGLPLNWFILFLLFLWAHSNGYFSSITIFTPLNRVNLTEVQEQGVLLQWIMIKIL